MQIYKIYISELNVGVKFKVLPPEEVDSFLTRHKKKSKENLKKEILQSFIYNLHTDVAIALNQLSRPAAERTLDALFAGCVMLNPSLDSDFWINIAYGTTSIDPSLDDSSEDDLHDPFNEIRQIIKSRKESLSKKSTPDKKNIKMTKQKFLNLEQHLISKVIGQDQAVKEVVAALTRSQADLHDENRPLGVFLFAGSSGVGKTHLANELHKYMFGTASNMVRIDCGEFQHKHENQKLLGCFAAGSKVLMSDGQHKNIEDVQIGEFVITHVGESKEVIDFYQYSNSDMLLRITISGIDKPIICTPSHELFSLKGTQASLTGIDDAALGWIPARSLEVGDWLSAPEILDKFSIATKNDGKPSDREHPTLYTLYQILNIEEVDGYNYVYDLSVKDHSSYCINGLAVHNSPPGYVGHDDGGQLTNQVKKNPNTVILIDEVEKAHQDIWNTFLRIFDEGILTDSKGELVDFRNTVIILTTNLGNDKIVNDMISTGTGFLQNVDFERKTSKIPAREAVIKKTNEEINKYFKPELLNRIDKIIVFNHLTKDDCSKIARLEMSVIAEKLSRKGISLEYTDNVLEGLMSLGVDTVMGARGISQVRRDNIETALAETIVKSSLPKGTIFYIDYLNDSFTFDFQKPIRKQAIKKKEEP